MDQLLESRLNGASSVKLEGLSPDRFGKSAYAGLSYTPSKLAGNVLFKQAASMRRVEESNSKAREWEAMGQLLRDKLRHLQEEKEGMEQTLTQQITMYKRILGEAETAHERSLMALQGAFSDEMQRVIQLKEEEAKFVQSEKELLENRILELEEAFSGLKNELEIQITAKEAAEQTISQLTRQSEDLVKDKERLQTEMRQQAGLFERQKQQLTRFTQQRQLQYVKREEQMAAEHARLLQQSKIQKQKAIDSITASHREQLLALQQQRISEARTREEETRNLKAGWQMERRRMEQAIQTQKMQTQLLNEALQLERDKSVESMRKMAADIATLTIQKQQLEQEVQTKTRLLTETREQVKRTESASTQTTANLQTSLEKLKRDLQMARRDAQAQAYEREKQRLDGQEMRKQIAVLRKAVQRTSLLLEENSVMSRQLKGLKDLLVESSMEMQRCKGEFLRLDKEKQILLVKMRELDLENETLYHVRLEMEEEARVWRETYYLNRR